MYDDPMKRIGMMVLGTALKDAVRPWAIREPDPMTRPQDFLWGRAFTDIRKMWLATCGSNEKVFHRRLKELGYEDIAKTICTKYYQEEELTYELIELSIKGLQLLQELREQTDSGVQAHAGGESNSAGGISSVVET